MAHNSGDNGGWFAVSRTIFDHYLVGVRDRPYTELEAWLWLLATAAFEKQEVMNKGEKIVIDPGQLMAAHSYLAKVWDWTPDKVRWYLKRLQNEAMITRWCATQNANRYTNQIQILTICNYSHYQVSKDSQHQAKPQAKRQAGTKPAPTQHHDNKEDNSTRDNSTPHTPQGGSYDFSEIDRAFDKWWAIYPASERKVGRGECLLLFREAVTGVKRTDQVRPRKIASHGLVTAAELLEAVQRYADFVRGKDVKLPAPATWLNQARWLDLREQAGVTADDPWWTDADRVALITMDRWRAGIAEHANGKWPIKLLGPPPGHPQCVVPHNLVSELRLAEKYNLFGGSR